MIGTPTYDLTNFKVHFGRLTLKAYTKGEHVLRIEATTNDVSFFKHHRKVERRDGSTTRAPNPSLPDLSYE